MSEQTGRKRCSRCDGIGRVPVRLAFAGICTACHGTGWVWANITDPDDEFYTGCADECEDGCEADHRGEQ